jgi:hypothetical protein
MKVLFAAFRMLVVEYRYGTAGHHSNHRAGAGVVSGSYFVRCS